MLQPISKIREANHPSIHVEQLIEYHPEIAFKQLNANIVVEASKKTDLGRNLRQQLIADYLPEDPLKSLKKTMKRPAGNPMTCSML